MEQSPFLSHGSEGRTFPANNSIPSVFSDFPIQSFDLAQIRFRVKFAMDPRLHSDNALRDCDVWFPAVVWLWLTLIACIASSFGHSLLIFPIACLGSIATWFNMTLLGSSIQFFPAACALGYSLIPIAITATITTVLPWLLLRILATPLALAWSVNSMVRFCGTQIRDDRAVLFVYPCALVYSAVAYIMFVR
jgi:hypothetical protein